MTLEKLNKEYDKLQLKYGNKYIINNVVANKKL